MSTSGQTTVDLHGECDPRFDAARAALTENFATRGEVGSALCVYKDGEKVVDLWGGHMDAARLIPWQEDTLSIIYSISKSMCALCVHILADRGEIDLEAPVATYWPEFAQAGKEAIKVRHVISHNCGVIFADAAKPDDIFHWNAMIRALEVQEPAWPPETKGAYNSNNIGFLAGELVRRVTGQRVQDFLYSEVAKPLGAELWLGVPEDALGRCADIVANPAGSPFAAIAANPDLPFARANKPASIDRDQNSRRFRTSGIPSFGGFAEARALARIYAALGNGGEIDGIRLLSPQSVERATATQWSSEANAMTGYPMAMSIGFWKNRPGSSPFGDSPDAFGHLGSGGPITFADPGRGLAVGYVMNFQTAELIGDPRVQTVVDAVLACAE
ncbi:MAG: serine hydrolase domain-containing protein [Alphaproteobacteria bacterium]|jgi:CubicO group peptidase (beta-lactamase class C family)